jgi:hypothetical protein
MNLASSTCASHKEKGGKGDGLKSVNISPNDDLVTVAHSLPHDETTSETSVRPLSSLVLSTSVGRREERSGRR